MDAELSALRSTAAATVVQLLATTAWEQARSAVGRLRRLVSADPPLVEDLRRVVAQLCSALAEVEPSKGATITMQATTSGTSRVNQAGRDLYITTGE